MVERSAKNIRDGKRAIVRAKGRRLDQIRNSLRINRSHLQHALADYNRNGFSQIPLAKAITKSK